MRFPVSIVAVLLLSRTAAAQSDASTIAPPLPEKLESNATNLDPAPSANSSTETSISTESTTETTTTERTTEMPTAPPSTVNNFNYFLYCSCDLAAGRCDLNCCCDLDCTSDDRALFTKCWTPPNDRNEHMYCSRNDYAFAWNSTSFYKNENGGLFCVVTDNVPRYRVYEEKPPLKGDDLFRFMVSGVMNRWMEKAPPFEMERWVYEPFYREGSPLFTLHMKGALGTLRLPGPLNSAYCNVGKQIEFLRDRVDECHLKKRSCKPLVNPQEWLSDLAVFRLPPRTLHGAGNFTAAHGVQWNDADKLAPVILRVCDSDGTCRADVRPPNATCQVQLVGLTLRVGFNGTQGVLYVLADMHYSNSSIDRAVRFEVVFQPLANWAGGAGVLETRSGNPGYLLGKALLSARFNQTSGEGTYYPLVLFPGTRKARQVVFGQDSLQTVQIWRAWRGNVTEWCSSWQSYVLKAFWGSDLAGVRVGPFGNSNLRDNKMDQWLPVEVQSELSCFSTAIRSDLMVVYTKAGTYEQPQNKIIGVALGLRSDREAKCNTLDGCTLLLTQHVLFVHSETGTATVLPQPPRWRIHLPHDFFYPFLLSSSGAKTSTSSHVVHLASLSIVVHHFLLYFCR